MKYNIVLVANEGYIQHAAVMLCSLFETNKNKQFDIYLLTDGIAAQSNVRLQKLCKKYGSRLIVKMPEQELGAYLGINLKELPIGKWNTMMYYKLFMPVVLPQESERCLFLDVDMIINDDIETLYNWNLDGVIIAAAEDMPDCLEIKERLHLQQTDKYINSGVMVCDLKAWRTLEVQKPIFEYVKKVSNIIINEQDVIALYFRDKLTYLSIRWNMTTFYFMRVPKIFEKYLAELPDAKCNPGIIHFAAPIKPWFRDCIHPYGKLYKKFIMMTSWSDYQFPYGEKLTKKKRFNKTIKNLLNRFNILKDPHFTNK